MSEPEPEPSSAAIVASAPTRQGRGRVNPDEFLAKVEDIDLTKPPTALQLRNPGVAGNVAVEWVDQEIKKFYENPSGLEADLRFYAVFSPSCYSGLHFGIGDRVFSGLATVSLEHCPLISWSRTDSLSEARKEYLRECSRHQASIGGADTIYLWR